MSRGRGWVAATLLLAATWVHAHEVLPASLMLQQLPAAVARSASASASASVSASAPSARAATPATQAQVFDVRWRVPVAQGVVVPAISPRLPAGCAPLAPPRVDDVTAARLSHWRVRCANGLRPGARIGIDGLDAGLLDAVVHVAWVDGRHVSALATPAAPTVVVADPARARLAVGAYFTLGVEHILTGIDHLMFVLCLMLLVRSRASLLKTITAFTLAHSVTLALSALGVVHVPQPPVEAVIALSILFLACELAAPAGGQAAASRTAMRRPWLVAFSFGLLHGFGFAGALSEVGLPAGEVPAALLLFNLGVEAGQLMFVGTVLSLQAAWRRLPLPRALAGARLAPIAVQAVGAVAAFWWLQRTAAALGLPVA